MKRFLIAIVVCSAALGTSRPTAAAPLAALIIDGQNNHNWKATTPVLRETLEGSGDFTVDVATSPPKGADLSGFRPRFGDYDVVISNYNGALWAEETRQDFEAYVSSGGGFVTVHAGDNAFSEWPAYNAIIGVGGWRGRDESSGPYVRLRNGEFVEDHSPGRGGGHGQQHEFLVETRAPEHPIMRGLPSRWRHTKDELYDKLRGPAKNLTVLATAHSTKETGGTGEHEPVLMAIHYEKGRCFHTTLGHNTGAMEGMGFKTTLLRGAEWAATGQVGDGAATASGNEWKSLFNGKDLTGWRQINGTATYRAEGGAIVGTTNEGSPNSFLCSEKHYGDFELELEVKVDNELNSGIQIRSNSFPDYKSERVHGYQVEIAVNGTAGFIYDEARRGWLSKDRSNKSAQAAFRKDEWNRYYVRCVGDSIKTWVNGVPVADVRDDVTAAGFIGLQVHGIGRGTGPYEVRWRNLKLRNLD
jgi:type 1 glutamine amidotransferase